MMPPEEASFTDISMHPEHPAKTCSVCGQQDEAGCEELRRLGTRSLDADHDRICPVCGGDYALIVWTGMYKMCELCAENRGQAERILKHKHNKRLNLILAQLEPQRP
jgi:hypothetical protein